MRKFDIAALENAFRTMPTPEYKAKGHRYYKSSDYPHLSGLRKSSVSPAKPVYCRVFGLLRAACAPTTGYQFAKELANYSIKHTCSAWHQKPPFQNSQALKGEGLSFKNMTIKNHPNC